MAQNPNRYVLGLPPTTDPKITRIFQDLVDRINFLLDEVARLSSSMAAPTEALAAKVGKLDVSLQAVQDALTSSTTFVGFGDVLPGAATASVQVTGSGVGYALSGPSNAIVITVTNAATARGAIVAAIATAVGAHTITLAALTGGGATGSITWNNDGTITAFVDPT